MTASRMIFATLLAAVLVFALGCGSKPEPTQAPAPDGSPGAPSPAAPTPTPDPKAGAPKAEAPVVWEIDQAKQVIPDGPLRGRLKGPEFVPTAVQFDHAELRFQTGKAGAKGAERVRLNLAPRQLPGQPPPQVLGREWKVKLDAEPGPGVPEVWIDVPGKDSFFFQSGYAMTLELGPRKGGKVAGKICLCFPDEERTVLAGTFEAESPRPPTEKPGADEAPYVTGAVAVTGAKPDAQIRVAYAGFAPTGAVDFRELQSPFDANPPELAQWTRDEETKTNKLVAGDGKTYPFRYEYVKLAPGRYLLSAAVVGGPAVWKWVDLPAGGTLAENFAIDAGKTGGVEVTVPAGVTGKVYLAPADDPARPPIQADLFRALSFQTVRQDPEVAAGKSLVKDLGPGKYEVRVGDLRGFADVAAGKTAELRLTPPKKP
jgi:hypothetical protein